MNLSVCPASCWLLCLTYVCSLLNVTSSPALGGITSPSTNWTNSRHQLTPLLLLLGIRYYKVDPNEPDSKLPSQSNEKRGHWVGFAEDKGDKLTWKILPDDTQKIITQSTVRSATHTTPN